MESKPRVFISHAHKDQGHCDELLIRLGPLQGQGLIDDIWHPGKIQAGLDKARERDDALARAHVVLVLASPDYFAAKTLMDQELAPALVRHKARQSRVIPILVRSNLLTGPVASLQALPRDGKPIAQSQDKDQAWTDVLAHLLDVLKQMAADAEGNRKARVAVCYSALTRLDRDKQWGKLLNELRDDPDRNRMVLAHGHSDQCVHLFVRRIEEFIEERLGCRLITVPMQQERNVAATAAAWTTHLRRALGDRFGGDGSLEDLLAAGTADGPLLIVLVARANPLQLLSDEAVAEARRSGLADLLTDRLPQALRDARRVTVLLPIERESETSALLALLRQAGQTAWRSDDTDLIELAELHLPTWEEVVAYITEYKPPLPDLPGLVAALQPIYGRLLARSATFDKLAKEIDNHILGYLPES